jgi:hypothetical protein
VSNCQVCDAQTSAFLCARCTAEIERALAELPADLTDLQAVATRQAAGPLGLGDPARQWDGPRQDGALGDAGWVFAPGAADQLWVVGNTVTTWARHLASSRGVELPAWVADALTASRWLLSSLDAIRHDEAAAQIHDEITSLPVENRRWIMPPPPEEEFHGLCDAADVAAELEGQDVRLSVGRCGTQLWSREQAQRIDCPVCGASYTRAERQASMLTELVDTLGTVRQVASTLTTLGRPVTDKQIRNMLGRGLIAARGREPIMVRVGDVLDQREKMLRRAGKRAA